MDDVEDVRALLAAALRQDGRFDVVGSASDAAGAVELVRERAPDLLLLDLAMPGGDGLTALPRIRAEAPGTRVVMVSGFPSGRLEALTTASGAVGYVQKGLSIHSVVDDVVRVWELLDNIEQVLRRSASLPQELSSSAAARRFVEDTLQRWDHEHLLDTVNLLVSELVTNVVVHARSEAEVAVLLTPEVLRVEVSDESSAPPTPRDADDDATSGRGMALIDMLATAWGVTQRAVGKTIWFEVPRPTDAEADFAQKSRNQ